MNDDILLLAERERAARARVAVAARDLRSALAPSVLTKRAVRARPWAALAVAGAGGAAIGLWLAGSRAAPAPASAAASAAPGTPPEPKRSASDWLKLLVQVGQVVGTVAAAKNAAAAAESSPANV